MLWVFFLKIWIVTYPRVPRQVICYFKYLECYIYKYLPFVRTTFLSLTKTFRGLRAIASVASLLASALGTGNMSRCHTSSATTIRISICASLFPQQPRTPCPKTSCGPAAASKAALTLPLPPTSQRSGSKAPKSRQLSQRSFNLAARAAGLRSEASTTPSGGERKPGPLDTRKTRQPLGMRRPRIVVSRIVSRVIGTEFRRSVSSMNASRKGSRARRSSSVLGGRLSAAACGRAAYNSSLSLPWKCG